ncbi:hypothetical protein BDR06DRAFT_970450 [Suillus hirtellus]|nr:hypothetical protein BDR06DRAFT_970450 [Suillus hirtellus]
MSARGIESVCGASRARTGYDSCAIRVICAACGSAQSLVLQLARHSIPHSTTLIEVFTTQGDTHDYHEAKVTMSALVKKRRLMSWLNSVKVPVGAQGCRVLKMTTSLIWQGRQEDLEHPEETAHAWAPRQLVIVCGRCRDGKQQWSWKVVQMTRKYDVRHRSPTLCIHHCLEPWVALMQLGIWGLDKAGSNVVPQVKNVLTPQQSQSRRHRLGLAFVKNLLGINNRADNLNIEEIAMRHQSDEAKNISWTQEVFRNGHGYLRDLNECSRSFRGVCLCALILDGEDSCVRLG